MGLGNAEGLGHFQTALSGWPRLDVPGQRCHAHQPPGCFGGGAVTLFNSVRSLVELTSVTSDAPESGSYFSILQMVSFFFNLLGKQIVLSVCPSLWQIDCLGQSEVPAVPNASLNVAWCLIRGLGSRAVGVTRVA